MRISSHYGMIDYQAIADGKTGDCKLCPVAVLLKQMLVRSDTNVEVHDRHVNITQNDKNFKIALSDEIADWIDAYDNEVSVMPQSLILKQSTSVDFDYKLESKGYFDTKIVIDGIDYLLQSCTAYWYSGNMGLSELPLSNPVWKRGTAWTKPEIQDSIIVKAQQAADFTMKDVALELVFISDSGLKRHRKVHYFRSKTV